MSEVDVSLIVPLRDQEAEAAAVVRLAASLGQRLQPPQGRNSVTTEILALDQRSGDNTLSVLSLLHGKISSLRTVQDVEPGRAIARATRLVRGAAWFFMDGPIDPELGLWGISQVLRGHRAALVPGEMLAVDQPLGVSVLPTVAGGLVSAQRAITRHLRGQNLRPLLSPPSKKGARHRAQLFVRGQLGRFGLGRLDRPHLLKR